MSLLTAREFDRLEDHAAYLDRQGRRSLATTLRRALAEVLELRGVARAGNNA